MTEDIRDIKPLLELGFGLSLGRLAALVAALLLVAAGVLVLIRRLRARRLAAAAPPPQLPPDVVALAALDRLQALDLSTREGLRAFYFAISAAIRQYLEARFGLPATDLTSEQILGRAAAVPALGGEVRPLLQRFLGATDLVKFADHWPAAAETDAARREARRLVETTRPAPAPPSLPAAARRGASPAEVRA